MKKYLNNWRFAGYNTSGVVISFNIDHVVMISNSKSNHLLFNDYYEMTLSSGDKLLISESTKWAIEEGELWFENHKEELGEGPYERLKKEYYEERKR